MSVFHRRWALGLGAWCSFFCALGAHGCTVESAGNPDESNGGTGGSGGGTPVVECTTATEIERYRSLFGPGVAVPPECETDLLNGYYEGQIATFDSALSSPGRNRVGARFEGLSLVELDGVPCEPVYPGEVRNSMDFGSDELNCEQFFACGCCIVTVQRSPLSAAGEPVRRDVWTVERGVGCQIGLKNADYYFNFDFDSVPPPPTSVSSDGDACSDCLSGCQGVPSCCTGTGCACEGSCRPAGCLDGFTYCCGPDGFCFCTDGCPY